MLERLTGPFARSTACGDSPIWRPGPAPVLRVALFAILGVLLVSGVSWGLFGVDLGEILGWLPGCAFRTWTGLPCPGCGMGHALIHLSRLQWVAAVGANPAAPFLIVAMLVGALRSAPDAAVRGMNPVSAAFCLAVVVVAWLGRVLPIAGVSAPDL